MCSSGHRHLCFFTSLGGLWVFGSIPLYLSFVLRHEFQKFLISLYVLPGNCDAILENQQSHNMREFGTTSWSRGPLQDRWSPIAQNFMQVYNWLLFLLRETASLEVWSQVIDHLNLQLFPQHCSPVIIKKRRLWTISRKSKCREGKSSAIRKSWNKSAHFGTELQQPTPHLLIWL